MHQPIGSSDLYSSALVYRTQSNTTGNLLTTANSIHSRARAKKKNVSEMFFKSIPARGYVDKCGQSITACTHQSVLDKARQGWYFSVREIIIVCQCFHIATWYDTDETGTIHLKAGVEIDPAPQRTLKKMNEDRAWWFTISDTLHVPLEHFVYDSWLCFYIFFYK